MKSKMHKFIFLLLVILGLIWGATFYYRQPYVKRYGKNSITVYAVDHRPALKALFVVIARINGRIIVEIIRGPGLENIDVLEGKQASFYLQKHALTSK